MVEFADVGVRRASMDYVARRAGVSRSTLYRRFANKDELLVAVGRAINVEGRHHLVEVTKGLGPKEAVVEAFCETVRQVRTNPVLRKLLDTEPETLDTLIGLAGPGVDLLLEQSSADIAATLRRAGAKMPSKDLHIAAEVLYRVMASLSHATSRLIDVDDDASAREFAEKFMAPLVW